MSLTLFSATGHSQAENTKNSHKQIFLFVSGDFKIDTRAYIGINGKKFFTGKIYSDRNNTPILSISLDGVVSPDKKFTIEMKIYSGENTSEETETLTVKNGGAVVITFVRPKKTIWILEVDPGYTFPD